MKLHSSTAKKHERSNQVHFCKHCIKVQFSGTLPEYFYFLLLSTVHGKTLYFQLKYMYLNTSFADLV